MTSIKIALISVVFANLLATTAVADSSGSRFMQFPDVSADNVVFVYRDDIWVVATEGGEASLLADHGIRPRHPKFSPDGKRVAFSAEVNGNLDVYIADLDGGPLQRLTFHPARDDLVDWGADGESVYFKSNRSSHRPVFNRLFRVDAAGGLPDLLPLPYVETAAVDPDNGRIVFSYLKDFQEEVWKRYQGGRAPDLWSFDLETLESEQLTDDHAQDSVPMIVANGIAFLSEREGAYRSNVWLLNRDSGDLRRLTHYRDADVRNPSAGEAGIVYELDGRIYLLDPSTGRSDAVDIGIRVARHERQPRLEPIGSRIENGAISTNELLAFEARGDVVVYNASENSFRNISETSNAAERFPSLSPDGRRIAYQSDTNGEYQLHVRDIESGEVSVLTDFSDGFRYRPFWSPDGKYIAFMDQAQVIWLIDVERGQLKQIDQGHWRYHWDMPDFRISWSPDSRWLTYSRGDENRNHSIYVVNVAKGEREKITAGFYSDFNPVFSDDGNYIFALALRSFVPTFGDVDTTFTYDNSSVVTVIPLKATTPAFDDVGALQPQAEVTIDFDDIESRLQVLPFKPARYSRVFAGNGKIFALQRRGAETLIHEIGAGNNTPEVLWQGSSTVLDVTADRLLFQDSDKSVNLLSLSSGEVQHANIAADWTARIDPAAEFLQMFDDSWRYQRDFFYDPGLHGVDWTAVRSKYRPLAAQVHSAQELTAVVREMHAELAAGHVYVSTEAPYARGAADDVGLLGIDFDTDAAGNYRVGRIIRPGVRRSSVRSSLDNSRLDIEEGDYVLSVNGRALSPERSPYAPFHGLAGKTVELEIADNAAGKNRRRVSVKTLSSEQKLRELDWVEKTRAYVEERSDGRIGYIYVPNTGAEGQNELVQMYRAQYHKDALIVDERFNTGGALGDRFVELLNRPPLNYFSSRNASDYPLPEYSHRGPKAMLINSWSYSGGDGFPFLFKQAGVGPLIGSRTWGGLIGPGMRMSLINGGFISAPPQRVYDTKGQWAEGNEGVRPNIAVRNNPGALARGVDEQLERAIDELLEALEELPPVSVPPYPEKMPLDGTGEQQ